VIRGALSVVRQAGSEALAAFPLPLALKT